MQVVTVKFDGSNYLTWSKSVLIFVQGKDKEDYLTGEIEASTKNDPCYRKWKTENAMVMGWLINSMKPEISDYYMLLKTAHQT